MDVNTEKTQMVWIHARIPARMQGSVEQLIEKGHTKTEIAKAGIRVLCKQEGIKA